VHKKQSDQPGLFPGGPDANREAGPEDGRPPSSSPSSLPEGFRYQRAFLSANEERDLLAHVQSLPFKGFEFHGFVGNRRVVSFGWRYDFGEGQLQKADDMPPFLLPLRRRAAQFAGLDPDTFQHALVTEYSPGAGIGWHRDKAVFDEVVGLSLVSPCRFRFRRKRGDKWERAALTAEARSAYLLAGPSRTEWEHSIPPMDRLRYSITFRNFGGQ
jgi:alkylated DNA repair dioxygenase AlkB